MLKKAFLIFLCFLFPSYIFADGFTSSGDLSENQFFDTLGFGVGSLPKKGDCPNCIEYDSVVGQDTQYLLSNTSISDITSIDPSYALIRNPNLYASLSVPPYTHVDFIYWYKNSTGHSVEIDEIKVYLTRYYSSQGDLRNVLDITGIYESTHLQIFTWIYPRGGYFKSYDGLGMVNNDASGVFVLDTIMVKSPIVFDKWEASVSEDVVNMKIFVRNITNILEKDIVFSHGQYFFKRDFQPNQEYVYEYELPFEDIGSFGYATIYNPNSRKECTSLGEHLESYFIGDSAPMSGVRGEGFNYIGSRVKPWSEAFCITRTPYAIHSSEMIYMNEVEEEIVEDGLAEISNSEVLGISKLPQTNYPFLYIPIFLFLVVVVVVWYYHKRKIQR
ncbi:hypothetical protein CVU76_03350 [Candidatus Dojkabacteria bacterium HGW-Dojkabacteria-1]|uniref:Uncharacterized protein n=1 Tax=Candidatus Dojkabacteria bacterium HGW-Dojkabacteria-1 TaxID=2013761 RepID=A0A2N2F499_9BACT|nr:MAG: hypothetical protein CVU76_03350 [Candidatus Dojkabacteria bacterium HGW-Dojkabacteria-1]